MEKETKAKPKLPGVGSKVLFDTGFGKRQGVVAQVYQTDNGQYPDDIYFRNAGYHIETKYRIRLKSDKIIDAVNPEEIIRVIE